MTPFSLAHFALQSEVNGFLRRAHSNPSIEGKLVLLRSALEQCKKHGLSKKQATVHCQLCRIYAEVDGSLALEEANNAISADPNSFDVSIMIKVLVKYNNLHTSSKSCGLH